MVGSILKMYFPSFAKKIVYMLQATEYQIGSYLKWFWRTDNFSRVMRRRTLIMTKKARLLVLLIGTGILAQEAGAATWFWLSVSNDNLSDALIAVALFMVSPALWGHLAVLPVLAGDNIITRPFVWLKVRRAAKTFAHHPATIIAVAGSYGKTTMKEILLTILSEGKKVAATPANKNVSISHAQFAKNLNGDEEILIIEFGEGAPGDVARFCKIIQPNIGVITGLAPTHLDKYKTLQRAGEDIFHLATYLDNKNVYVNHESPSLLPFIKKTHLLYDQNQAAGWKISDIKSSIHGVSFKMKKANKNLNIKTSLLGEHQVGPLAVAAAIADKLSLSANQIESGVAKVKSFEHRMKPREAGGAWIIDDTYNGNIEGMIAGLKLLKKLPAKRKIYVTPGLVDQGKDNTAIHHQLGQAIGEAKPDLVVLIKHSVTDDIVAGIKDKNYRGQLVIEEDPVNFYTHLDQFVAAGDLALLQNDWPDNYF